MLPNSKTREIFVYYKILIMNAKRMHCFNVTNKGESKTAIMQIESIHVCSALWRIRVDIMTNIPSPHFLHYVVYMCQNHKILWMHSCVRSKNVKWCHLIWPTLYMALCCCSISVCPSVYLSICRPTVCLTPVLWQNG